MRNAFADEVTKIAAEDQRVVLLSGDIGNRLFDDFKDQAPDRMFNCGVAEANMMSVAAGMALSGLRPVVYTITPFVTTRCLEQIRVDVCYHKAPVTIVGVGSGLGYASLGATHQSLEDIAFLRLFPEMLVLCPSDPAEARGALRAVLNQEQPAYIRLGKKGEPSVHDGETVFHIGRANWLRPGTDVCLIGTGAGVKCALDAAAILHQRAISAAVVEMHTVKPVDEAALTRITDAFPVIATVEEHNRSAGLGGVVAEWICDRQLGRPPKLLRFGTGDTFLHEATSRSHAQRRHGMAADQIAELANACPRTKRSMMRIGVDFDNTIVRYDDVFRHLALEQNLIPPTVPARKQAVRDYLRANGQEEDWIRLQGEVYGPGMTHARPFDGVFETFAMLQAAGAEIFVISHRTRHPFRGPQYDLHAAAGAWLRGAAETPSQPCALARDRIFFETTKEAKLDRIRFCGCTHFIDDLPEFLTLPGFPPGVERILFDPGGHCRIEAPAALSLTCWREIGEHLLQ